MKLLFFEDINDANITWAMVQKLTKITYEKNDKVFVDG